MKKNNRKYILVELTIFHKDLAKFEEHRISENLVSAELVEWYFERYPNKILYAYWSNWGQLVGKISSKNYDKAIQKEYDVARNKF